MTPTATYIAEENCLQELPCFPEPSKIEAFNDFVAWYGHVDMEGAYKKYNKHVDSLRPIPCSDACKEVFKDGKQYKEGKDYELRFHKFGPDDIELFAFPLSTAESISPYDFQACIDSMAIDGKIFVDKSMAIANRICELLENKGLKQKDLAAMMGKTEAEISRMLAGMQNLTLRMISKVEAVLGEEIISITH